MATKPPRKSIRSTVDGLLTAPVDIAGLAAFRVLFGLLMAAGMVRFLARGWVHELYVLPAYHFTYPGFGWVRPWPDVWMQAHFVVLALLAAGVALGCCYRACITLFCLGFTYVELIDQTAYLNHYYLVSLVSGLLIFMPAHRAWSVDAWRRPRLRTCVVPAWTLHLLRFQFGVVYLFAGLAKWNGDWLLQAQPLRIWLPARSDLPWVGPWLEQAWVAYAASWIGALFDSTVVFFLLSRRTRPAAFAALVAFHVATWLLFNIGMFPWIMIAGATVFFPPGWPRLWLSRVGALFARRWPRATWPRRLSGVAPGDGCRRDLPVSPAGVWLRLAIGLYVAVQLALPLRAWGRARAAAWTCAGFNCAWQVMIAEKTGYAEFFARDAAGGERRRLRPRDYLTARQEVMMDQDPYLIRALARRFARDLGASAKAPVIIQVNAYATLNGRPSRPLIDPTADLAGQTVSGWILPLQP